MLPEEKRMSIQSRAHALAKDIEEKYQISTSEFDALFRMIFKAFKAHFDVDLSEGPIGFYEETDRRLNEIEGCLGISNKREIAR